MRDEDLNKSMTRKSSQNFRLSDREMEAVERLSRGIVNKLLHGPKAHLRKSDNVGGDEEQAAIKELSSMFRLEEKGTGRGWGPRRR